MSWNEGRRLRFLAGFTAVCRHLLKLGLPLPEGLERAAGEGRWRGLEVRVCEVASRLRQGEALSEATARAPELFDEAWRGMVQAGERHGSLPTALDDVQAWLDCERESARALHSASFFRRWWGWC